MEKKEALGIVFRFFLGTRTQKEVARNGNLSETEVSFVNNGQRMPRPKKIAMLAKGLDRPTEEIAEAVHKVKTVVDLSCDPELLKNFGRTVTRSALDDEEMEILTNINAGKLKEYLQEKTGNPDLIYPLVRAMKPFFRSVD